MGKQKAWSSAVISGIIAFLTALLTAFQGENVGFDSITPSQWITAIIAFFVAFGGTGGVTFRVSNSGAVAASADEPPDSQGAEPPAAVGAEPPDGLDAEPPAARAGSAPSRQIR